MITDGAGGVTAGGSTTGTGTAGGGRATTCGDGGDAGVAGVITTLSVLLRQVGPSVLNSLWFSPNAPESALPLGQLLAVESIANELAPRFLTDEGRIVLLDVPAGPLGGTCQRVIEVGRLFVEW